VKYFQQDITTIDWDKFLSEGYPNIKKEEILIFLDDHQNFLNRIEFVKSLGLTHVLYEDNYPISQGDTYSPKKILSMRDYVMDNAGNRTSYKFSFFDYERLTQAIDTYQEMPPIIKTKDTRWGDPWGDEQYPTKSPYLTSPEATKYPLYLQEANSYTWICYMGCYNDMIDANGTLVIGNKPYYNFSLSPILDKFKHNIRCNFAVPGNNNGNVYDQLALCNHLYENFVHNPASLEKIIDIYDAEYDLDYIQETYTPFLDNMSKYGNVFHADHNNGAPQNKILQKLDSPYRFSKIPRAGLVVVLDLIDQGKEVFVTNFSITDEVRHSYCLKEGFAEENYINGGSICHSLHEELDILRWLHTSGHIDASLCLLEDNTELCFIKDIIQPTNIMKDTLLKIYKAGYNED
jgi:hypothetical protein